jgi:hypothetical protein
VHLAHPLSWIPKERERIVLLVLLALEALSISLLALADFQLRTDFTPMGIVSFQFAGNGVEAKRALMAWGEGGRIYAAFCLGADYLFLVVNALLLALLAGMLGRKLKTTHPGFWRLSAATAWVFILAGVCDAIENALFIPIITGQDLDPWARWGMIFASAKFLLLGSGMLYLLTGCGYMLFGTSKQGYRKKAQ